MGKDPRDKAKYLQKSRWLADVNNERPEKNATYRENMMSLTNYVMVEAMSDSMVHPHVSEQHAYYKWGQMEETEQLKDTEGYKGDWIGLKSLDEAGRLAHITYKGDHLRWSRDFWENTILPYLAPPAESVTLV